jgi:surface antigen
MGLLRQKSRIPMLAAILCALMISGCSYKLGSLVSADDNEPQSTGAIEPQPRPSFGKSTNASAQTELDLVYARATASEVLSRGGKDASVPWQNPQSGAGGSITPLATSYSEAGMACRDFLASYLHGELREWLQGAACQSARGAWEVKRLKPLKSG